MQIESVQDVDGRLQAYLSDKGMESDLAIMRGLLDLMSAAPVQSKADAKIIAGWMAALLPIASMNMPENAEAGGAKEMVSIACGLSLKLLAALNHGDAP